ncbi:SIR2 family protein [Chitinophagaceae bacterium LB-8]|uniref:SIR2 family protein n=1 Tax=Paraflavisolibacter caeni TaxID=2982496 RepID=A0A9X2XVV3_9BACT|nr:SIR2 family protein [Paraflavisolibacter caeni]MCU7549835.1 SIR2 family protein [Paraflavisolibacter caeni]
MSLEFKDVVSHIAALYRQGILVPFIGSGMSRPTCTDWTQFIKKIAKEAGIAIPKALEENKRVEAYELYRIADIAVTALRALDYESRAVKYRNALKACDSKEKDEPKIPIQTKALAKLFWPLVLTTNYDDLYWSAATIDETNKEFPRKRPYPVVMGRSLEDCHQVLRSLDEDSYPILWTLQGFLGGQVEKPEEIIRDPDRRRLLINQLVVGHQQYQRAINADEHFRRAFSEVFRRRSLLFIGSGILEDYLVNLFSEIIYHHGSGPYPHFALVDQKERERFDSSFLQARLGIIPVFYNNHNEIPQYLDALANQVRYWPSTENSIDILSQGIVHFSEIGYTVAANTQTDEPIPFKVILNKSRLPLPENNNKECSVVSVGRENNSPKEGAQAESFLKKAKEANLFESSSDWIPLDKRPSYVFRYGKAPIFAIAARRRDLRGYHHDRRDLSIIPEAICAGLVQIDNAKFEIVHLGPIASGRSRPWHPIHPFAQTIRGIKLFLNNNVVKNIRLINIYVVDQSVWYPIISRKVPIAELLSSELSTNRIELKDTEGNTESFSITLKESPTLKELLELCKLERVRWKIDIRPKPTDEKDIGEPSDDLVITPTMTLVLTAKVN